MKRLAYYLLGCTLLLLYNCKEQQKDLARPLQQKAMVTYAKGFNLVSYDGLYLIQISQPFGDTQEQLTYVAKKAHVQVPDSLLHYPQIEIPIQRIACTSTTHIPPIAILEETSSLVGFAGLDYVSTTAVRKRIDAGQVKEIGQNDALTVEVVLDLQPDLLLAFAMNKENKSLHTIEQAGIPVVYNGDWLEQNPLGKAEWIKLFGVLYDKEEQANRFFDQIVQDYTESLQLIKEVKERPTVLSGVMYGDVWYLPEGKSWAGVYFKDAQSEYLWSETTGTGSLSLSFEHVFEKAQQATFWMNPGHYETLADLAAANPHYKEFDAFKNNRIYSFAPTKGATGGSLFYELGSMRPDLVLKDLIYILHPNILPDYQPHFYRKLQ